MQDYTEEQVIEELKKLYVGVKTRKAELVDRRYYLIAVLAYKFKASEKTIFSLTNLSDRSSVNLAKRVGVKRFMSGEPVFLANTKELAERFPYDFPKKDVNIKYHPAIKSVNFKVATATLQQLEAYAKSKDLNSANDAAKYLVLNFLKQLP
jgi:hypothetical protein